MGSFRDREVACSASDHKGSNFKSCVWKAVSSNSSPHPQEVLLVQISLYLQKGGLNPFHFISFFDSILYLFSSQNYPHAMTTSSVVGEGRSRGASETLCGYEGIQTYDINQMLMECWADIVDNGPTMNQSLVARQCWLNADLLSPPQGQHKTNFMRAVVLILTG